MNGPWEWFFGERDALGLGLRRLEGPEAGWGEVALWCQGRCLTENLLGEQRREGIAWSLEGLAAWLDDNLVAILNEEPFPEDVREPVGDALAWDQISLEPPLSLEEEEEDAWFSRRSAWRRRHRLGEALPGAVCPELFLRRRGDQVELSWAPVESGRAELSMLARRGHGEVEVALAAQALEGARAALGQWLRPAATLILSTESWRWLVPWRVAAVIEERAALRPLLGRLRAQVPRDGLVVPHSLESLALQDAPPEERALAALARALEARGEGQPWSARLQALRRWSPAPAQTPWREGYQRAQDVREALGWGDAPSPCLSEWLSQEGVAVEALQAPAEVQALAALDREARAWIWPNAAGKIPLGMSLAASWGHLLMDARPDTDYAVTHQRSSEGAQARARAFAAMLLMPREGVRDALEGQRSAAAVRRVMDRFETSAGATTWHLKNLGFLGEEERVELLNELR